MPTIWLSSKVLAIGNKSELLQNLCLTRIKKLVQTVTWPNATIPEWQEYTSGAPGVCKIPEGCVIIEMYNTVIVSYKLLACPWRC